MENSKEKIIWQLMENLQKLDKDKQEAVMAITEKSARCFIRENAISGEQPLVIYGSDQCPDCIECLKKMNEQKVQYEFRNITGKLQFLKEYIEMRDHSHSFIKIKREGKLGIPCIYITDDVQIFDWGNFLTDEQPRDERDMLRQLEKEMEKQESR